MEGRALSRLKGKDLGSGRRPTANVSYRLISFITFHNATIFFHPIVSARGHLPYLSIVLMHMFRVYRE